MAKATDTNNVLLVEGKADRDFFKKICEAISFNPDIQVASPNDLDSNSRNGKQSVLKRTDILLKQFAGLETGNQKRLAIIVDADYKDENGLGCEETVKQFSDKLNEHGFCLDSTCITSGFIFKHSDGLSDIGLWVMPNNQDEGMLEDWIKDCIHPKEQPMLNQVKSAIDALKPQKFKTIHRSKAEVATWLAWQKKPGHGLYWAAHSRNNLLDAGSSPYTELVDWLKRVYV
jgi:hypothetical protein